MLEWLGKEWTGRCKGRVAGAAGVGTLSLLRRLCGDSPLLERLISQDRQSWISLYIKELRVWCRLFDPLGNLRRKYLGKDTS